MSKYTAKIPDAQGNIDFTEEEDGTWAILMERQQKIIKGRACQEFIDGLDVLKLPEDRMPQCPEISTALMDVTGWSVQPVSAIISASKFFDLLANKKFPAATFIRTRADLDYLQEPDLFHEYFGHCPLLTNQHYAEYLVWYGQFALKANQKQRNLLARLFWFTIEFGLLRSDDGFKVYGGGILSSKDETIYAVESDIPERRPLDVMTVLRTPYRVDIMQPIYYYLDSLEALFHLMKEDLIKFVDEASEAGDFVPTFVTC